MMVAVVAHLFVRAPQPDVAADLPSEAVAALSSTAEPARATMVDELPRVTVLTRELVAVPTDDVAPPRRPTPAMRGAELLAVGTTGREPDVTAPIVREAVHTPPTDEAQTASISDGAPVGVRPDGDRASKPEAALELSPMAASRKLAGVPRSDPPAAAEREIRTAPIVERAPDQKSLVLGVLHQYADAFGRLDAEATKAVYPTVNYVALRRAFNQLEAQRLTFESCDLTISGRDANAKCQGEAAYRPRIGPRTLHRNSREWTFDLAKADDGWQIVKATVR